MRFFVNGSMRAGCTAHKPKFIAGSFKVSQQPG